MAWNEWQAVLLCSGSGNGLLPITENNPKCLVPVAGLPLFWYQLKFLEMNGFKGICIMMLSVLIVTFNSWSLTGLNIEYLNIEKTGNCFLAPYFSFFLFKFEIAQSFFYHRFFW